MSVYAALSGFKGFFQPKSSKTNVSNLTFDLHRMTAVLLLACSILTTSKQFFGDPIHCSTEGKISVSMFQSYCFMAGTFTVGRSGNSSIVEAHPGVGQSGGALDNMFHSYYQWVCIILVFQAAFAYFPYHLWKLAEGGRVSRLLVKLSNDLITETSVAEQVTGVGKFLRTHRGWFNGCSARLLLCQMLCVVATLTQLYLMDTFLNGNFLHLGSELTNLSTLSAALELVFPKVVKCSMNHFGPSGNLMPQHGLCTLPVNVINEKIYLVLWVWFILLAISSLLHFAYSFFNYLLPTLRQFRLRVFCPSLHPALFRSLFRSLSYGDIVLLRLIAKNCDTAQFTALLSNLATDDGRGDETVTSAELRFQDTGSLVKRKNKEALLV